MIELNKTDPNFSMVMEVLCCLPLHPVTVPLSSIRDDLGLNYKQSLAQYPSVRRCLLQLRDAGHKIILKPDGGWSVTVSPEGWARVKAEGQAYWDLVYGEGSFTIERNGKKRPAYAT